MAPIIRHIVEQHAEEAAFLWLLRDRAVDAPHYALRHLARLDERIEAHIDGLRVAGEAGWEIAAEALAGYGEAGEAFAAGVLALESRDAARIDRVIAVTEAAPESTRGLVSAIGWVQAERLRGTVHGLLRDPSPHCRMLGVAACSVHRANPGPYLLSALDDVPPVRSRALRLAGELGRVDVLPRLLDALNDPDEACRFWAAWAAGLLGERMAAIPALCAFVEAGGAFKERALQLVLRIMLRDHAMRWLKRLNGDPRHARTVTQGAGILGDPVFVPWLIGRMADPGLARLAGESLAMITGVDLAYDDLDTNAPEGFQAGPTDEPSYAEVEFDPDEDLPWPDPVLVQAWWEANATRFPSGARHLLGRFLSPEACEHALAAGFQRQRRAGAHELALAHPEAMFLNWQANAGTEGAILGPRT